MNGEGKRKERGGMTVGRATNQEGIETPENDANEFGLVAFHGVHY